MTLFNPPSADHIYLQNPSFEGTPKDATAPPSWIGCEEGTTPDILPGPWGVLLPPFDGETFMGLITRNDGSWESVGQRLSQPMKRGECYSFSLQLARSTTYENYNMPIQLKIWGGTTSCNKKQLLGKSSAIEHATWKEYEFQFYPKADLHYIIFEAYYQDGVYLEYRGNVLLDDCSAIVKCDRA